MPSVHGVGCMLHAPILTLYMPHMFARMLDKLECIETKATADKNAKCNNVTEGKISVRDVKVGSINGVDIVVCARGTWVQLDSTCLPSPVVRSCNGAVIFMYYTQPHGCLVRSAGISKA